MAVELKPLPAARQRLESKVWSLRCGRAGGLHEGMGPQRGEEGSEQGQIFC